MQLSKPVELPFVRNGKNTLPFSASLKKRRKRSVVLKKHTWHAESSSWLLNLLRLPPRLHLLFPHRRLLSFLLPRRRLLLFQLRQSLRKLCLLLLLLHRLHRRPHRPQLSQVLILSVE